MTNEYRERSDYVFELSHPQIEALLAIAMKEDRPFEEIVLGAIDRYIEAEKKSWPQKA
jgi:hypothetical protein